MHNALLTLIAIMFTTMALAQTMPRVETQSSFRYTKRTFYCDETYLMHKSALMTPMMIKAKILLAIR